MRKVLATVVLAAGLLFRAGGVWAKRPGVERMAGRKSGRLPGF